MRKTVALIVLVLLIFSCSEEKKEKVPETKSISVPVKSVQYIFETGKTVGYKLTTNINSSQSIESDTSITTSSNQKVTYTFGLEVISIDNNNIADISIKTNSIIATAEIGGDKLEYDLSHLNNSILIPIIFTIPPSCSIF